MITIITARRCSLYLPVPFPVSIEGTAPGADFWLMRTEDTESEFPVEEDFWVAGAEFADSLGADIISSSLGYFAFDDPSMNYKYSDMDGNTAFITRAADIAASKGILPVNSAGNERDNAWIHIIAPSDGDTVLAVGAVDGNNSISVFSSAGPSYDRRIKPDVVAQGVSVPVQVNTSVVERAGGTSFSCPVISGMCACIMQAVPEASDSDIIAALHSSSDRFLTPDSLLRLRDSRYCQSNNAASGEIYHETGKRISGISKSIYRKA